MDNSCFIVLNTPNYEPLYKHFFSVSTGTDIIFYIYIINFRVNKYQIIERRISIRFMVLLKFIKKYKHFKSFIKNEKKNEYKYFFFM